MGGLLDRLDEIRDRLVEEIRGRAATTEVEPVENKWVPVVSDLQRQVYYRQLGIVSVHGPVTEMVPAAAFLSSSRGGEVYWVAENRVARWDNVTVYPGVQMSEWLFGGPRNTVLMRLDWWALYVVRVAVAAQRAGVAFPPFDDPSIAPFLETILAAWQMPTPAWTDQPPMMGPFGMGSLLAQRTVPFPSR